MTFQCIPSIDLKDGRCVRLFQGDYAKETVFYTDPLDALHRWFAEGADVVHIVDLNGARGDTTFHRPLLARMLAAYPGKLEVGGGVRTLERADELIAAGACRVVFGSAAVRDPELCIEACRRWPEHTVVGLDARDGLVAVEGWTEQTRISALELAQKFSAEGLRWIIYTDIERDGTLTSPNLGALRAMVAASPARVIASGGVSDVAHVLQARDAGAAGAIIGRALYDGRLSLGAVLAALGNGASRDFALPTTAEGSRA